VRMNKRVATGVAVAAGALALGTGIGFAGLAQAEPTPTPSPGAPSGAPSTGAQPGGPDRGPGRGGPHGRGGMLGADLAKQLAEKLGVTEAKVTEALKALRDEHKADRPDPGTAPDPSTRPDPAQREAELAKALAGKLGVDEAKVKAALDEIRADRDAERAAALKGRLDAAVKEGSLTQAEADAVTKAVEKGVIGGGPR
jgi:ABC-type amino acid transport substrate-binding protein